MQTDRLSIRVATPDDALLLTELIAASYATLSQAAYDPDVLAAALPLMSRANPTLLGSGAYFVAEAGGRAAGCGGWSFEKPGSGEIVDGVTHIRHFATHPAYHRKGVARALLDHCIAGAAHAGARLMKCQSTLPAERLYAAAGFRRIGLAEAAMGPGLVLPVIEMERDLP